jgi:hypothetical protein
VSGLSLCPYRSTVCGTSLSSFGRLFFFGPLLNNCICRATLTAAGHLHRPWNVRACYFLADVDPQAPAARGRMRMCLLSAGEPDEHTDTAAVQLLCSAGCGFPVVVVSCLGAPHGAHSACTCSCVLDEPCTQAKCCRSTMYVSCGRGRRPRWMVWSGRASKAAELQ